MINTIYTLFKTMQEIIAPYSGSAPLKYIMFAY